MLSIVCAISSANWYHSHNLYFFLQQTKSILKAAQRMKCVRMGRHDSSASLPMFLFLHIFRVKFGILGRTLSPATQHSLQALLWGSLIFLLVKFGIIGRTLSPQSLQALLRGSLIFLLVKFGAKLRAFCRTLSSATKQTAALVRLG
jgi:hypothetical protein